MNETSLRADILGHRGQKSDHIMLDLSFNGINSGDIEIAFFTNNLHGLCGYNTKLGLFFTSKRFNFKPDTEAIFRLPDLRHFRPRITWNHFFKTPGSGFRVKGAGL